MEIDKWKSVHQVYELRYHKEFGVKWCQDEKKFNDYWNNIFEWIEVNMPKENDEVLDIGSGPRPVLKRGRVVEPLANEYSLIANKEWWKGITIENRPAENFIPEIENKFDFILCWNAIDHSYEPLKILENIKRYLKNDGVLVLATDCKTKDWPDDHPILGISKEEFIKEVQKDFIILKKQEDFSERDVCLILKKI